MSSVMLSPVFLTLHLVLMGEANRSLSHPCFQRREVTIFFDLKTWVMNQGHLFQEMASILNVASRQKCFDVIIRNHQKSIRVNEELTEDDLMNIFYTMHKGLSELTDKPQVHIDAIPQDMPNIASGNMTNKTLKMLQEKGHDIVIASAASGFGYSNDYFHWLLKHRFVFLSVGAQHGDKFLGKTQSKTITDLLLNPNFDRFKFLKSSYHSESLTCPIDFQLFI